jgi:hypothetical protein
MIGWKKVVRNDGNQVILKLYIDKRWKEKNTTAMGHKASKAVVTAIYDEYGYKTGLKEARSMHDRAFSYVVGKTAVPSNGKDGGIWFWKTLKEAVNYNHETKFEWLGMKA